MAIYRKHINNKNEERRCYATHQCPFGGEEKHFYYDSSIRKKVLNPESPVQKTLNRLSPTDLHDQSPVLIGDQVNSEEYQKAYSEYEKATEEFEERKQKIIDSYPVPKQDFVRQLAETPQGPGLIGGFEIFDADYTDNILVSEASQEEKIAFAKSYLKVQKTEERYRSTVSSYLV